MRSFHLTVFLFLLTFGCLSLPAEAKSSASITGVVGLNTVPSARMDDEGTIRTTVSRDGHYVHGSVGAQISSGLYFGLRQTVLDKNDTHLFPGMDVKLRLLSERQWRPEIS
ncbi:MAG TPA: YjbH domain-containing protein, partial [Alphaproteobacteria bacterium]|nr:YjbH domain-containing protein [Alphaproteobacteria bacterium]